MKSEKDKQKKEKRFTLIPICSAQAANLTEVFLISQPAIHNKFGDFHRHGFHDGHPTQ